MNETHAAVASEQTSAERGKLLRSRLRPAWAVYLSYVTVRLGIAIVRLGLLMLSHDHPARVAFLSALDSRVEQLKRLPRWGFIPRQRMLPPTMGLVPKLLWIVVLYLVVSDVVGLGVDLGVFPNAPFGLRDVFGFGGPLHRAHIGSVQLPWSSGGNAVPMSAG